MITLFLGKTEISFSCLKTYQIDSKTVMKVDKTFNSFFLTVAILHVYAFL